MSTTPLAAGLTSNTTNLVSVDQPAAGGSILTVGDGMMFATLGQAIAAAHDNDVIAIKAGTYVDNQTDAYKNIVLAKNVTIEGMGGMVHIVEGVNKNGKAIIVGTAGLTLKNIELSGASTGLIDGNLAGVRADTGNLTLINTYIHDNQAGVMGGSAGGVFTIDHSEIADNGSGSGYTHNIYVGNVDKLTITNSYIHGSKIGHEIKSRAATTIIENNVIADGATGTASYVIDIPNAGVAVISNNIIEKGPLAANFAMIHYGGETQFSWPTNSLTITGNTMINDDPTGVGVYNQSTVNRISVTAQVQGNTIYGLASNKLSLGAANFTGNTMATTAPAVPTTSPWASASTAVLNNTSFTVNLTSSTSKDGQAITGGNYQLTVNDSFGNIINSGSGRGITVVETGTGAKITTQAGTSNSLYIGGSRNTATSAGNDQLYVSGVYQTIILTGKSNVQVAAQSTNTFSISGTVTMTDAGGGTVNLLTGGTAAITATTANIIVNKAAGSSLTLAQKGSAETATVSLTGGAATVNGAFANSGAKGTIAVTTTAGASDQIVFGSGTATATVKSYGTDTITAGAGPVTVTGYGGAGSGFTFYGGAGIATITTAAGATDKVIFGSGGGSIKSLGTDTITGGAGAVTVTGAGAAGSGFNFTAGTGAATVTTAAGATDRIAFGSGGGSIRSFGTDTITAGTGNVTITGAGGAGSGFTFTAGSGTATVTTAAGATDRVTFGAAGGTMRSYGTDTIAGGSGNVTVTGVGGAGSGFTFTAGTGTATLTTAAGATDRVTFGAAGGTIRSYGTDTVTGGSGAVTATAAGDSDSRMTFIGGAGAASIVGGAGSLTATAGSGALTVQFGSGTANVQAGAGADLFKFLSGKGGGTDIITGYQVGVDHLSFSGVSVASQSVANGSLNLVLSDNTHVTLVGVTQY